MSLTEHSLFWLGAIGLCAAGLLVGLIIFLGNRNAGCERSRKLLIMMQGTVVAALLTDILLLLHGNSEALVFVVMTALFLLGPPCGRWLHEHQRGASITLLLLSGVAACWFSTRVSIVNEMELSALSYQWKRGRNGLVKLEPVTEMAALTDKGAPVPLSAVTNDLPTNDVDTHLLRDARFAKLNLRVMQIAPATCRANCHGWVFTGGQFVLNGDMVDRILTDNGYVSVDVPRPGDLIIYRDSYDAIMHTGLVRLVDNSLVLIESKFGNHGCYLHQPQHSIYSDCYQYYRSARAGGHLLSLKSHSRDIVN